MPSTQKSKTKFQIIFEILSLSKRILIDKYLNAPVFIDILISASIIYVYNKYFQHIKWYDESSLNNLLSELVSITMALGGFVLAAMSIVATMKDSVRDEKVYKNIIVSFTNVCYLYGFLFIYFSILSNLVACKWLFSFTYFGLIICFMSLIRCVWLIRSVIGLPIQNK